jgi:uncharacterized protein (TIGR02246 family)
VQDVSAIEQLHYRYAWAIDGGQVDADGVAACFTADARWFSDGRAVELRGQDEIRRYFAGLPREIAQCLHYITNVRATVGDGGRSATATAYLSYVAVPVGSRTPFFLAATYENTCVKQDGQWLFAEVLVKRRLTVPA